jgi:hypothetical protein
LISSFINVEHQTKWEYDDLFLVIPDFIDFCVRRAL